ncbi:MAG: hypothetical protein RLZZ574_919 [Cyanobacteriota bacterium]
MKIHTQNVTVMNFILTGIIQNTKNHGISLKLHDKSLLSNAGFALGGLICLRIDRSFTIKPTPII